MTLHYLQPLLIVQLITMGVCNGPVGSAAERPNILFISVDDMNDWVGCLGEHPNASTPHIDRLAQRGALFTNAHCVSPICGPSRAAVLTGMRPETTGVYHNRGQYRDYVPDAVAFPQHFRAHGYTTYAAGKVNHDLGEPDPLLWDENGPDCGVLGTPFIGNELDTNTMTPTRTIDRGRLKITLPANGGLSAIDRPTNQWDSFDWAPLDVADEDYPDHQIATWSCDKLGRKADQPMLLAAGFYKPHQPFFAPRRFFDLHMTSNVPNTVAGDLYDIPQPGRDLATKPWTSGTHRTVVSHHAWHDAVRAYLATISFVDDQVGRVVDALDSGPHADNTWIILWSDHGWSLGQKEHWGKHAPWRENIRVPLIIVPPRNHPTAKELPARCDALVSLLDLYPTLLDMAGLPARSEIEGRSLLPLVRDPNSPWSDASVATIGRGTHSVESRRWRYIEYFDGSEELYDLEADPDEWFNLAARPDLAHVKERLKQKVPSDTRFRHLVRWGRFKCVIPIKDDPMLFDLHAPMGISEQNDVAADLPDVVKAILSYVDDMDQPPRRIAVPEEDATEASASRG